MAGPATALVATSLIVTSLVVPVITALYARNAHRIPLARRRTGRDFTAAPIEDAKVDAPPAH